jgi:allophanate hydrolase subunit 2
VAIYPRDTIAYLGIADLLVGKVLGSSSYDTFSQLGMPPIKRGDVFEVAVKSPERTGCFLNPPAEGLLKFNNILQYLSGPYLPDCLATNKWTVSSVSRSGIRLSPEEKISNYQSMSLSSYPMLEGAIQMPNNNEIIILGPDSGVTGGYPVIGRLSSSDIYLTSYLRLGKTVSFREIDLTSSLENYKGIEAKRTENPV